MAIRVAADGRALLVANEGDSMTAKVVVESLGQIGQSTKEKGEAIGHKGIGFKSVLELSLTPEIYSGLRNSNPTLAVGFDPEKAREMIREASHDEWEAWDKEVRGSDDDPYAAIPILRFPKWIDDLPSDVAELRERGFDTVVRLPFDERFAERLKLPAEKWLEAVRDSLRGVGDRIFLLLGRFDEVRIEDRRADTDKVITRETDEGPVEIGGGATREVVRVMRNGRLSSRWRLFRRRLDDRPDLEEIAVGVRIGDGPDAAKVLSATDDGASAPFHLFFPTKIQSGLPFLLHAYFEVNAPRTGFYDGSQNHNERMLDELAALAKTAVEDAVKSESLDLASLVNLVAEAGEPEDKYAQKFRSDVLRLLDKVAWIPLKDSHEGRRSASPEHVFAERGDIVRHIGDAFTEPYIERRSGLRLPDAKLGDDALELVKSRPCDMPGLWEFVGRLCRPGGDSPWDDASADKKFLRLIELFKVLDAVGSGETKGLLDGLRGDPESRIIPAVGDGGARRLLPVPDPTRRERSRIVMSRRSSSGRDLVPPDDLGISFLHDGLLSSEPEEDGAKPLGVRPFNVDTVLDRLGGEASEGNEADLVRFLWKFLAGERRSGFGTNKSADRASIFDPSEWFWCDPGTIWKDDAARARQQRIRNLSSVLLPCRDGKWRKAGQIAFGKTWAEWLEKISGESPSEATKTRIAAYGAMEKLCPGSEHLLAHPDEVLPLLDGKVFENMPSKADDGEVEDGEADVELDEERKDAERHAFLLRLGVWEVPPIEAYESRERGGRDKFPWTGKIADKQSEAVKKKGGWRFGHGWENRTHGDVYVAEDHRFLWPLEEMARRNGPALVECLGRGAELYRRRANALVFCPWCSDAGGRHTSWRRSNEGDEFPSSLVTELRSEPWIPCTLDGEGGKVLMEPESAWWNSEPPPENALKQSPWRFVPHCGPGYGVDKNLRGLAGLNTFEEAPADAVERLLSDLRERFESGRISHGTLSSSVARQAFIGVHRMAYESLAKLVSDGVEAKEIVKRTLVLCEVGENLEYRMPGEARHDDGRFASYTRRFDGKVPFIVLRKDRGMVADALGVARFGLKLARKGDGEGRDVTEGVRDIHLDRIPELLAIVAHHSLGAQTLEPSGREFETRATRLGNLRIKQLDDLVVVAEAEGFEDVRVEIGAGSNRDLFLDASTPSEPILFHDFADKNWREPLRQKISPHFAAILESPTYAHTFMAFLQSDEAGREEFLHDLGISESDVEAIAKRIGAARVEEKERNLRWFHAILEACGHDPSNLGHENIAPELENSGFPEDVAHSLVEIGGGEEARRYPGERSALRMLHEAGTDLRKLDGILREKGDDGLDIRVAKNAFWRWFDENGQRLTAVLAKKSSSDSAKAAVRSMKAPEELRFPLDPDSSEVLAPVVEALVRAGLSADARAARALAENPAETLAYIGGFGSVGELDAEVELLLNKAENKAERDRVLRARASEWKQEIRLLAVLANVGENETPANIRDMDERVSAELPGDPSTPADLRSFLDERNFFDKWFGEYTVFSARLRESLTDSINANPPGEQELMKWAREDGVAVVRLDSVKRALDKPRVAHVRELKEHVEQLGGMRPKTPSFVPPLPDPPMPHGGGGVLETPEEGDGDGGGPREVSGGKVGEGFDRRKRELGDEGERWALAAVVGELVKLDEEPREAAINEISRFIRRQFTGPHADTMLGHGEYARVRGLDEEDLYEALSKFLHASWHSDGFGLDVVGWIGGRAMCLEVKSSAGKSFHLSTGEWKCAEWLHNKGEGNRYAVLVVCRGKGGGAPAGMDLLPDPVKLAEDGFLYKKPDGYQIAYGTEDA